MPNKLKELIEPFIYDKLRKKTYATKTIRARKLLTWNRLDLAFKLTYLELKDVNNSLANEIYKQDLKAQTLGKFIEFGNEKKNSYLAYTESFEDTFKNIKKNGFNEELSILPLSNDDSILNGSHRLASAIYLDKNVKYIPTELEPLIADFSYFFERDVNIELLELAVRRFIKYSLDNIYVAFLWPSGSGNSIEVESKFTKIVYTKKITLTPTGGFNLLIELYKHMDWAGNESDGFKGIRQKLLECFTEFKSFSIIVFQDESIENVRTMKEEIRLVHGIGYSSIHITDTKEEAIRISNLVLNQNGMHFLNYAKPYKYPSVIRELDTFKKHLQSNNIGVDNTIIDGSTILSLYGVRKNEDIDFLTLDKLDNTNTTEGLDQHDSELKYHQQSKEELVFNPHHYFQYLGLKFISFNQLYHMKTQRNEIKDRHDRNLMESLLDRNSIKKILTKLNQRYFYTRIKLKNNTMNLIISSSKKIRLYYFLRWLYRKSQGRL